MLCRAVRAFGQVRYLACSPTRASALAVAQGTATALRQSKPDCAQARQRLAEKSETGCSLGLRRMTGKHRCYQGGGATVSELSPVARPAGGPQRLNQAAKIESGSGSEAWLRSAAGGPHRRGERLGNLSLARPGRVPVQ